MFILEMDGPDIIGRYVSDRAFIFRVNQDFQAAMTPRNDTQRFPVWAYFKQPVFSRKYKIKLNPRTFWHAYKLEHLERCWLKVCKPEEHYNP